MIPALRGMVLWAIWFSIGATIYLLLGLWLIRRARAARARRSPPETPDAPDARDR